MIFILLIGIAIALWGLYWGPIFRVDLYLDRNLKLTNRALYFGSSFAFALGLVIVLISILVLTGNPPHAH